LIISCIVLYVPSPLDLRVETAEHLTLACAYLHNFLRIYHLVAYLICKTFIPEGLFQDQ